MKIAAFIHTATLHNHQKITDEVVNVMNDYGFLNLADYVGIGVVGKDDVTLPLANNKIEILRLDEDLTAGEVPTTASMQEYCKHNPDAIVFKAHVAGIKSGIKPDGSPQDPKYPIWRYLQYFHLFVNHIQAVNVLLLGNYDAVGVELQADPVFHFSGTHYIARASYINSLPSIHDIADNNFNGIPGRGNLNWHCCEFLPGIGKDCKLGSLFNTGYHWTQRIEAIDKVVKPYLNSLPEELQYWKRYYNTEKL